MKKFVLFLILGLILRIILSVFIYSGDVNNHVGWGKSILMEGSQGAYDRKYQGILQPTYPPLALYSFTSSYFLYHSIYSLSKELNNKYSYFPSQFIWMLEDQDVEPAFQKIFSIVSDLGISTLIYLIIVKFLNGSSKVGLLASLLYLFNPAVIYNSSLWGQLESPPLFFILLSIYFIYSKKHLLAHASLAFSMLIKQSSLIFFPIIVIFSLKRLGIKKTLLGLLLQIILFYIAYLPFFNINSDFFYPVRTYLHRIEVGSGSNYITDHAFNLWAPLTKLEKISDDMPIFPGINANLLGKFVFVGTYLFLLSKFISNKKSTNIFDLLGLVNFSAFMILTRMHERYLAPILPFMVISSSLHPQLWPLYFLATIGHLINMYHQWWYPTLLFLRPYISNWNTIYLVIIIFILSWVSWTALYLDASKKSN